MRNPYGITLSTVRSVTPSCSGDRTKVVYRGSYDHGQFCVVPFDEFDLQDKINSYREGCDLNLILKRYLAGDVTALTVNEPIYGDFSNCPKDFAGWFEFVNRSKDSFLSLPLTVREQFNNSVSEWFSSVGTDEWFSKMNIQPSAPPDGAPHEPHGSAN